MKRIFRKCLPFFTVLLLLSVLCVNACAQSDGEKKAVVRVGYFDLGSYYTVRDDGSVSSYDAAFLDEISQYTGYTFEYVDCKTWSEAISMLESHEIDLVGTMQWTAEREAAYEICDASYGYSVAELSALEDSPYIYQDYDTMNNATIGYIGGYVISNQLQAFLNEKNLNSKLRVFSSQTELDKALEDGEIDLVASNAHAVHEDWKVIDKIAYAPFYFASWKGNAELTESISKAIIKIHIYESNFADSLIKIYFPQLVSSPFSKTELDCIAENKAFSVFFDGSVAPLAWYDNESSSMQGVLIEVCRQLSEQTGLKIDVRQRTDTSDVQGDFSVSYRTLYYGFGKDVSEESGVTDSILDQDFEMYHKLGCDYTDGEAVSIAMVANRDGLKDYLAENYPNCTIVECENPSDCINKLTKDKVKLAFLNTNVANHILITENNDQVTALPASRTTFGIALQFHGDEAELFAGIVDKGIQMLDDSQINETLVNYALNTTPDASLSYLIKQHLPLTIALCVGLALLFGVVAVLFTYAKVMRRQRIRVEQANQARTDFFSRMSHDMRTPMNGILGMITLTKQASSMEEVRNNMDKAQTAGNYMLSLINDTLDLQHLESGKMKLNLQTVKAEEFFRSVLEMSRSSAEQKGLTYLLELSEIDEGVFIQLDPIRVKQILSNLISNAIKFTPDGGEIRISAECISVDEQTANYRFCIQDSGVGMSDEFIRNNMFDAYAQEHNKISDQYAGSGLGLAITKNIVEMMNGSISVQSELGEGTTFTVDLPFIRIDSIAAADIIQTKESQTAQIKNDLSGKKVLLAEDHPLNAEIVIRLLKKVKCETVWMPDGKQAAERFAVSLPNEFDAVLMDIRMPVMNGLDAARAIRAMNRADADSIPILALSANAYDDDVKACISAGMNAHLAKPVEPEALYAALLKLFS